MTSTCNYRLQQLTICFAVFASFGMQLTCLHAAESEDGKWFTQQPTVAESLVRGKPEVPEKPKKPAANGVNLSEGPKAEWIWGPSPDSNYSFQTELEGGSKSANLIASCDNRMTLFINGKKVTQSSEWQSPVKADVQKFLKDGTNDLTVQAQNEGGPAGFALKLVLTGADGKKRYVVTNTKWHASDPKGKSDVVSLGKMGTQPWGDVFANPKSNVSSPSGTPRNVFTTQPDFKVELLYTVPKDKQGSWVCVAFDDKGRLIASDQGGKGLCRITPSPIGSDQPTKVEQLDVKMSGAQGMLHAFGSLYCSVNGGPGSGFYRLRDTNGDDNYDEVVRLKRFQGGGEHGPHSVRLSPDGKSLYVIAGNHTNPPEFTSSRVPTNWSEDLLLPRQWDARGHARGKLAPGGWIAKTDPEGKTWEMFSIGYRNPYDMDFNADGELFAYDADMEWDMGTPWYRPTRVVHATSGSEFGWRSGTGKWPPYYIDSLPQLINIGPGSPVGVTFGYGTKFPAKYQNALFILDWTFGTIYAIHIEADGASYKATKEEFLARTPLPLTDAAVGPDGALYFSIGGRGTQSELYRVTYVGEQSTGPATAIDKKFAELRELRRQLERFHIRDDADDQAIEFIWSNLGHADRYIRYAARVALEHQPANHWQSLVLRETDPETLITAAVAFTRQADKKLQADLLAALDRIDFASLSENQQLELLRVYALTFIRMGKPDQETAASLAAKLDPFYPADSNNLNRELCRLLSYLNSPTVITKTLALMDKQYKQNPADIAELLSRHPGYGGTIAKMLANQPELQKIHYAYALRTIRYGWTLEQRKNYFKWFESALQRSGGASYQGFINNIRKEALDNLSDAERVALESTTIAAPPKPSELPKPKGPGRKWTLDEVISLADNGLSARNFENGRRAFAAARCIVCHRFDGEGGATGPDLTNVAGRFRIADLAEALVEPSKVISDQYRATVIRAQGKVITGRVVSEQDGKLTVLVDPEDATKVVTVDKDDIDDMQPSKTSLMPNDLLNPLNETELLDLIAYLMSRGNPEDTMFKH